MRNPTLVAVAHGSRDARFAQNARRVVRQVRSLRPDLDVRLAFLELSEPNLLDVLGDLSGDAVVVPLLLSDAYHARIDLPTVLSAAPARLRVMQACVLGADNRLLALARRRVTELGIAHPGVILSAVGSSDSTANTRTRALAAQWPISTTVFATGDPTSLADAAESLRARGATDIVVAPWFLSPGLLLDRVRAEAAQLDMPVAAPLGADRLVADVVVRRYASAIAAPVPTPH
ncbi:sirohydrochlorin chelatase [Mycobacteroides abscessus subsp. abscessus]|uniref:sirohydrochlorin chelatase n=1 Tax=Mycobacteroides abscessus TaxID=36809 RepID=UPI000928C3EB|nr:sirohydrochlorin chelatase [Mycobacteroides abscessus]MDO3093183.1 sirohydrochlorin chelatase [Mycobacteroides abscessus subsp. abscessus]PVB48695.1 sirohydrochlorin chelatase [Mycobacteroides abscessus]RIR72189.1 sirohydrochlorin chelatase [Mycobacteroides abscessus]SHX50229.1 cobalamin biosynthesis protein CbiX [Mycobacteroides abscessus subsp. abscessus]SHX79963.1 cobalamin biosynthesis protein CbiX [Mycobacteroides abscessus subsp. abscessus]